MVRGETRAKLGPLGNRVGTGLLAARLVDGGGNPMKVRGVPAWRMPRVVRHARHSIVRLVPMVFNAQRLARWWCRAEASARGYQNQTGGVR